MEIRQSSKRSYFSSRRFVTKLLFSSLAASLAIPVTTASSWYHGWVNGADQKPLDSIPPSVLYQPSVPQTSSRFEHDFTLRHVLKHGLYEHQHLYSRLDLQPNDADWVMAEEQRGIQPLETLHAKSSRTTIERLSDRRVTTMQSMYQNTLRTGAASTFDASAWVRDEVSAPDTTDKETILSLAKMSWNAYTSEPGTGEWQDETDRFNHSQGFGWEGNSLRGHIFADKDNSTVVIALKGTSPAVFDGAETTTNDKALREENRYYSAAIELYGNVTELYPDSNIWLTGHSLGGSTSSLLGLTFGLPTTTFEAPGEALAAARLGLPSPPDAHPSAPQTRKYTGAVHIGHTADPIFMGSCNAATSGCTLGGYSMQTECHTGCVARYDTVADKQWRVGIGYHKIRSVVHDVIEAYEKVPPCIPDEECVDCYNWKTIHSNGSEPSTTSSTSSLTATPTRTATCQTPGWWGCLDETTTTSSTSLSTSTSTTTSDVPTTSCVRYGWFGGCLETTTLSSTTSLGRALPAWAPTITTTRPLMQPFHNSPSIATKTSM